MFFKVTEFNFLSKTQKQLILSFTERKQTSVAVVVVMKATTSFFCDTNKDD